MIAADPILVINKCENWESIKSMASFWTDRDRFQLASGTWEFMRLPLKRRRGGLSNVEQSIRRWHPFDPLLVASPESIYFLPPVCVSPLSGRVHNSLLRRSKVSLYWVCFVSLMITLLWITDVGSQRYAPLVLAASAIVGYLYFDYHFICKNIENLSDRALFNCWIYQEGGRFAATMVCILVVSGVTQALVSSRIGGLIPTVNLYGALFTDIKSGQYWRYLTGPFIHSGAVHWISNLAMVTIAAGLAGAMGRAWFLFLLFMTANVVAIFLVGHEVSGSRPDALLGVSGGIFALFGWSVGITLMRRRILPAYLWVTILLFSLINIGLASMLVKKGSDVTHLSGFLVGLMFGLFVMGAKDSMAGRSRVELTND